MSWDEKSTDKGPIPALQLTGLVTLGKSLTSLYFTHKMEIIIHIFKGIMR